MKHRKRDELQVQLKSR